MIHSFETHIAKICGVREAILLYNIDFWIAKNRANQRHFYDGRYWTYNSSKAFAELFDYLTQKVIENLLTKLVRDGYLIKGNFNANSLDRTSWYALTDKYYSLKGNAFPQLGASISPNGEIQTPNQGNVICITDINNTDNKTDNKQIYVQNEVSHDCEIQTHALQVSKNTTRQEQLALFETPTQQESPKRVSIKSTANGYTEDFERFWAVYRRHRGDNKSYAFEAYTKAIKLINPDKILEALEKQACIWEINKTEHKYIPMCSTWLNKKRFLDDFDTIKQQAQRSREVSTPKDYNSYEGGIESFKNLRDNDKEADLSSIPKDIIADMMRFINHWDEIRANGGYTNAEVEQLERDGIKFIRDDYWSKISLDDHLLSYGYGTNVRKLLQG